jgi:hypothetical protein
VQDQDRTRTVRDGKDRTPARQDTAASAAVPQGLLALQARAGNAAVVRMLRGRPGPDGRSEDEAADGTGEPAVQRSSVPGVLRGSGRPLERAVRADMEARLGADFSDVRLHDDAAARASAAEVGARAYTSGSHVVIGEGGADRHTLAHELTHVIQQRHGAVDGTDNGAGLKVSDPSDRFEREAEATARRALSGPVAGAGVPEEEESAPSGASSAVQRMIAISPGMYMRGVGATEESLSVGQLRDYVRIAVMDEVKRTARIDDRQPFPAQLREVAEELARPVPDMPRALGLLTALVRGVNAFLAEQQTYVPDFNAPTAQDPGALVPVPNAATRYATAPDEEATAYSHTSLTGQKEPLWGDDRTMREKTASALGPLLGEAPGVSPRLGTDRSGRDNLPLKQITFRQATTMLPRPLVNLVFDVRYQLERPDDGQPQPVVDERTDRQKYEKDKSPAQPGALRSWHQDDSGKLPGAGSGPAPETARALAEHYAGTSQAGAGSSVRDAATGPRGFAEYTGTGSNWEHHTKVVLDYINKRVYLTLTHYQYWALIPSGAGGEPYTFWQGPGQDLAQAQAALRQEPGGERATMMSPWLEITF